MAGFFICWRRVGCRTPWVHKNAGKHFCTAQQLRESTTVDWQVRDSVRAKLRNLVRRALRKWKYPPDKAEEAIDLCLKQAEALSGSWVY